MRGLRSFFIMLLLCCAFYGPAHAGNHEPHYVTTADLPPQLLPPPPAEGSAAWKKNIQGVLAAQKHISTDDLMAMRDEQHLRLELIVSVIGADFTLEKFPRSYALLRNVMEDAEGISGVDKKFWHTRRPYLTDSHVRLMVDRIDQSPAYPSGHTTDTRVVAEVAGLLFPEHLTDLRAKADSIAHHRIEAGVHYPDDIDGGRMLAMLIVGSLMKSDDFKDDLAAARDELHP